MFQRSLRANHGQEERRTNAGQGGLDADGRGGEGGRLRHGGGQARTADAASSGDRRELGQGRKSQEPH